MEPVKIHIPKIAEPEIKYGGVNTILWHNSNLEYSRDKKLYKEALKIVSTS